jgi:uncharacterized protein (DUF169 family)
MRDFYGGTKMERFRKYQKQAEELERLTRLQSYVLAVKMVRHEREIPRSSERPLRDWGYLVPLCQGYALSRKEGKTVAMFQEDMHCFEPVVGYGWAQAPKYFLDGHNRFPQDVRDLRAGKNYAADFPRLGVGRYKGVVSAPLLKVNFIPDVILLYCNSAQLSLLLLGREYMNGHDLKCSLSSHAACVYSVVPVMQNKMATVAIPCRGDRYFAMAGDDEMILSIPATKIESLLKGLRHLDKYGSRLPRNPAMQREPKFPESYRKILKMIEKKN